jgi:hypothetical protein
VAAALSGQIYTSTDGGNDWASNNVPTEEWVSVASSADGTNLVALCFYDDLIYYSTNAGTDWTPVAEPGIIFWRSVASSADGSKCVAAIYGGGIYVSTDYGADWNQTLAPITNWTSVASSANGTNLVAAESAGGGIYVSTNSGGTWNLTLAPSNAWYAVASSADGTKLTAAADDTSGSDPISSGSGPIYTSTDSGNTWVHAQAPLTAWYSIASSASGAKLVAGDYGGQIYRWDYTPTLYIADENTNAMVSWVAAAGDFVLQQSPDLTGNNWTALTNVPAFNSTNSLNAVTLPSSSGKAFFRLSGQ